MYALKNRFILQTEIEEKKNSFDSPYDYGVVFFSQEKNKPSEEVIQWNGGTFIENIKGGGGQQTPAEEIGACLRCPFYKSLTQPEM